MCNKSVLIITEKFIRNAIHNMHSGAAMFSKCFTKCTRNIMYVSLSKRLISNYNSEQMHIKQIKILRNIKFPQGAIFSKSKVQSFASSDTTIFVLL